MSFSPHSLSSKQLCWDNSYYWLLSFMIGFHIHNDLLITVLRTSKGHLPRLISVTVSEHQSPQEQSEAKILYCIRDGWRWVTTGGSVVSAGTVCSSQPADWPVPGLCFCSTLQNNMPFMGMRIYCESIFGNSNARSVHLWEARSFSSGFGFLWLV